MKKTIIGIALALALVMGIVAFAEATEPATDTAPAAMDPVPAANEEAPAGNAEAGNDAAEAEKADDAAALQEAMEAYRAAKEAKRTDDLAEELDGYVEAGAMTREQADLILNSVKERMAVRNGECPNCGYAFRDNGTRMNGQKGAFGGSGQRGGRMNGQMPYGQQPGNQQQLPGGRMNGGQQPDGQSGATPQQPNGPMNGWQQAPQM